MCQGGSLVIVGQFRTIAIKSHFFRVLQSEHYSFPKALQKIMEFLYNLILKVTKKGLSLRVESFCNFYLNKLDKCGQNSHRYTWKHKICSYYCFIKDKLDWICSFYRTMCRCTPFSTCYHKTHSTIQTHAFATSTRITLFGKVQGWHISAFLSASSSTGTDITHITSKIVHHRECQKC